MADKTSILALFMVVASVAVLFGVYRHNVDVSYETDLGMKEHTLKLEETSRQLEETLQAYKNEMAHEVEKRRALIDRDIESEKDDVVNQMKQHISQNSRRLKSELLADPEIGKALSRRNLAVEDNDFTAILIQADNSGIKMGDNGETNLYRQGPNTLQTDGSFVVGDWLKFGEKELVRMKSTGKTLNVYGNLDVTGSLTATKLKSNYSHLSYVFKSAEQVTKGSVVSLLGGQVRKGYGITVGNSDVVGSNTAFVKVSYIQKNKFVVYYKEGNSGKAVIGEWKDGKLSVSTPAEYYNNVQDGEHHITVVQPNRIVAVFRERGTTRCHARIGTIDGQTLTWSTSLSKFSDKCNKPVTASIGSDKIAIVFRNSGNLGTGVVGKLVDQNTLNFGSASNFHSFDIDMPDITRMADDLAVFTYLDKTKSSRPMVEIFKSKGTEVFFDSKKQVDGHTCSSVHVTSVNNMKAVVAFRETGTSSRGRVSVVDIVSGYLEVGDPTTFTAIGSSNPSVDSLSLASLGADQMSGTTPSSLNRNRVLVGYRDHMGHGKIIDGDVIGKLLFMGKRKEFTTTKASSAMLCAIGENWVVGFQDDNDGNKGKVRIVSSHGGARALGIATTGTTGAGGDVGVALQGIADFSGGTFNAGGIYYADNDGMITSASHGVALGRALTDSLLLLENLATQNLFDVGGEVQSTGGSSAGLLIARWRTTQSKSNGHWTKWNQLRWASGGTKHYEYKSGSGEKIYIRQEGIYHVTQHFGVVGSAHNWAELHVNGQNRARTWESSRGSWWHDLHFCDIFQAKKDWYIQTNAQWASSGQAWSDSGQNSGLTLMRIRDTYDA